jgi:hypothetical protein
MSDEWVGSREPPWQVYALACVVAAPAGYLLTSIWLSPGYALVAAGLAAGAALVGVWKERSG